MAWALYTVIDRTSPVNYKIQLLGVPLKTLVVHYERLKHCFGTPKFPPTNNSQSPQNSLPLYSEVVTGQLPLPVGGYTILQIAPPIATPPHSVTPECLRRAPVWHEDFVAH